MQLPDNWKPQHHKACSWTTLDDETVVVHAQQGTVSVLNGLGGRVWSLCDGSLDLETLTERLCEEFDAPADQVRQETGAFLADMISRGLVYPPT